MKRRKYKLESVLISDMLEVLFTNHQHLSCAPFVDNPLVYEGVGVGVCIKTN